MNPRLAFRSLLVPGLLLGHAAAAQPTHPSEKHIEVPQNTPKLEGTLLGPQATAVLKAQGLVISTQPRIDSFHLGYTGLFKAHQPLYFTADSFLYAFHRSYDALLQDVERGALKAELGTLLAELRQALTRDTRASPETRAEVDLFLTIGQSLLTGNPVPPVAGASAEDVANQVAAIQAEADTGLFAATRKPASAGERLHAPWPLKSIARMDFSMLKPRGHYTSNPALTRYFQALMWLQRAEFRLVDGQQSPALVNRAALEAVVLLDELFTERAQKAWTRLDQTLHAFVGPADSLSFPGLRGASHARGLPHVRGLLGLSDAELVKALGPEASERILSRLARKSEKGEPTVGFLLFGQRYVFDSEVLSAVSHGQLEQKRMMPSPLDVAWAAWRSPAALPLLEPELTRHHYRDALEAVATRGEQAGAQLWQGSLYHLWLGALRGLSPDEAGDTRLPALLRSEPWRRRMLNTQLASWAELRHDTLLYAKQSTTAMATCEFPRAYVDPYPEFFRSFEALAARGKALVGGLEFPRDQDARRIKAYFEHLGEVARSLRVIAEHEREGRALTPKELDFMNHLVSVDGKTAGCTRVWEAGGWYADLFYQREDALQHEPVIADVHTQPTDASGNPVGKVLHVATGHPRLMTVTLDLGKGPLAYRGFVSSYFEHTTQDFERLTDEQWRERLWQQSPSGAPAEVPWLRDLLAR